MDQLREGLRDLDIAIVLGRYRHPIHRGVCEGMVTVGEEDQAVSEPSSKNHLYCALIPFRAVAV